MGGLASFAQVDIVLIDAAFGEAVDAIHAFVGPDHLGFTCGSTHLEVFEQRPGLWIIATAQGPAWGELELREEGAKRILVARSLHLHDISETAVRFYTHLLKQALDQAGLLLPPRGQRAAAAAKNAEDEFDSHPDVTKLDPDLRARRKTTRDL